MWYFIAPNWISHAIHMTAKEMLVAKNVTRVTIIYRQDSCPSENVLARLNDPVKMYWQDWMIQWKCTGKINRYPHFPLINFVEASLCPNSKHKKTKTPDNTFDERNGTCPVAHLVGTFLVSQTDHDWCVHFRSWDRKCQAKLTMVGECIFDLETFFGVANWPWLVCTFSIMGLKMSGQTDHGWWVHFWSGNLNFQLCLHIPNLMMVFPMWFLTFICLF